MKLVAWIKNYIMGIFMTIFYSSYIKNSQITVENLIFGTENISTGK